MERTGYTTPRIGETLSPGLRATLEYLGVWEAFAADRHRRAFGTAAAWGSGTLVTRDFMLTPFGTAWHLDRRRFDATLAREAEAAGAVVLRNVHARVRRLDGGWQAQLRGHQGEVTAAILVDATGRAAAASRRAGARRQVLDRMVAVTATVPFPATLADHAVTLVETFADGWWYSARLPSSAMMVALMTDAESVRKHHWTDPDRWWALLRDQPHHAARFGAVSSPPSPLRTYPAFSSYLSPAAAENWVAVGDAACCQDPLSGSGIARALDTGIQAARAVDARLRTGHAAALMAYSKWMAAGFQRYWTTRLAYYALEQRWPKSDFWRRRQPQLTLRPDDEIVLACHDAEVSVPEKGKPAPVDPTLLASLCQTPAPAHEIVRRYIAQSEVPAPDIEVILALQQLQESAVDS